MKRKRRAKSLHIGQDDYLAAIRKAARELDLAVGRKPLTALHKSKKNYTRKVKHKENMTHFDNWQ